MKIAGYENNNNTNKNEPLLPLVPEKVSLSKSNSTTFDLPLDPSKPDGPSNQVRARIVNGSEGIRAITQLLKDVDNVAVKLGLKVDNGTPQFTNSLIRSTAASCITGCAHSDIAS